MNTLRLIKPGDSIGVFAPGSPTRSALIEKGQAWLEKQGYNVVIPRDPSINYARVDGSFSSDTVENRIAALNSLLDNDRVSAIICARGAYGSVEILPSLDFSKIQKARKAIIGYSDATVMVSTIPKFAQIPAIHGPNFSKEFAEANDVEESRISAVSLLDLLSGKLKIEESVEILKDSVGVGPLLAGNLSCLTTLLGTPFEPDFTGSVLVIEETGESPYRIHRMLMQLLLSGKLSSLAALCFGRFSNCEGKNPPSLDTVLKRFLSEHLNNTAFPVVTGLRMGHGGINLALPAGIRTEVSNGKFRVLDPIVS